jgi:hypothetical protein
LGNFSGSNFSNEPEAYYSAETEFSVVKFSAVSIFQVFFKPDAILNFFKAIFQKKISIKREIKREKTLANLLDFYRMYLNEKNTKMARKIL